MSSLSAQSFGDQIKSGAIEIDNLSSANDGLYEAIESFQLIMVGEMHGTMEPALFVQGLALSILHNEPKVSIGIEAPHAAFGDLGIPIKKSDLLRTDFFQAENIDERNGSAWFDLILWAYNHEFVDLFFIDNYEALDLSSDDRDSVMYISVIQEIQQHPDQKIITLSGNIHNWLIPYKGDVTMGTYCNNDSVHFMSRKICAVEHIFSEGTMLNNIGNGPELRSIDFQESVYSQSTAKEMYFMTYETNVPYQYNAVLYTRSVSVSSGIEP